MIPIIIADDEKLDLEYLLKVIDYRELGLEIVAVCREGRELMRKIDELNPRIVITDIVMPEMSGLEIAHKLRELKRNVKLVFITGHQNFKYAQTALEYTVSSYIIKPVLPEQLKETLSGLAAECIEENRRAYENNLFRRQLEQNMPLIRDVMVRRLLRGTLPSENPIEDEMRFCGISLRSEGIVSILILPKYQKDEEYSRKLTYLSVKNAADDFFGKLDIPHCSMSEFDSLCLLFNLPGINGSGEAVTLADRLHHTILAKTGVSVTIGVGRPVDGFGSIPDSFTCAERALEARFYLGGEQVISFGDIAEGVPFGLTGIRRYQQPLCDMVRCGNDGSISQIIRDVSHVAQNNRLSVEYLRIFCVELLSKVISAQYETSNVILDNSTAARFYIDLIGLDSVDLLLLRMEEILLHLSNKNRIIMNDRTNMLVEKIKRIIEEQYSQDISIDSVATQAYISSGYATRIFKKVTGISINTHMTNVRMKKATELLVLPEYRIKDVAKAVGYANMAYFCSVFRKQFGKAPNQYRMQMEEQ